MSYMPLANYVPGILPGTAAQLRRDKSREPAPAGEQPREQVQTYLQHPQSAMASWFRKRKKKAPEPIALVGLECGVDDEGDDEERVPLKTFSHRMGPDWRGSSSSAPVPRHRGGDAGAAERRVRAALGAPAVRDPLGTKATSSRLRSTVWKSTRVSGALTKSFGDDVAALAPSAERNRHRHAIEQVSRRWRGRRAP